MMKTQGMAWTQESLPCTSSSREEKKPIGMKESNEMRCRDMRCRRRLHTYYNRFVWFYIYIPIYIEVGIPRYPYLFIHMERGWEENWKRETEREKLGEHLSERSAATKKGLKQWPEKGGEEEGKEQKELETGRESPAVHQMEALTQVVKWQGLSEQFLIQIILSV